MWYLLTAVAIAGYALDLFITIWLAKHMKRWLAKHRILGNG